jgi:hypothetical protein
MLAAKDCLDWLTETRLVALRLSRLPFVEFTALPHLILRARTPNMADRLTQLQDAVDQVGLL